MDQEELHQKVQHFTPCRLRFNLLAAIPSVEQECKKSYLTDRYEADISRLFFYDGRF